jgi:CO/xanthine dehydrogenase Mo-binding subunit/aerobic-type carbon monoxide dehydrogenase small subunit (CoxS/CutS family)
MIQINLTVNGEALQLEVPKDLNLMHFLRDYLGLTGTKNGCAKGHCGACTVLVDGAAKRACLVKLAKIQGSTIITIEGLAKNGILHPLQYTFIKYGAMQCGFCTPGTIMTAVSLLNENPTPGEEEIKAALTKGRNLCRCTGYVNIIKAIQEAGQMIRKGEVPPPVNSGGNQVETILLPEDGVKMVTGATLYGADIEVEGMLYGKMLWAEHPHARILKINTSKAEALPGVEKVITADDIPGINQAGLLVRDQPAMAFDKVRYIGDPVAVVFAETEELAEEARQLVEIEYEVLPGVFSIEEAAKDDAPKVHKEGNLAKHLKIIRGDVEDAFKNCAVIVEDDYSTSWVEHGYLEVESGLAYPAPDGGVVIKIGTQNAFGDREQLAEILGLPEDKVRIIQLPMGGAFGGKEDILLHQHLALGAYLTGKPVKIVLSREESFRVHVKRHPSWMHYKVGADQSGKILALQSSVEIDTGAYFSNGHKVLMNMVEFGAGPYYIPNLHIEGKAWFTNNIIGGAMRGFGVNQVTFALESQIDEIARHLGMDPFEIRLINGLDVGLPTAADHIMEKGVVSIKETILAAEKKFKELALPDSTDNLKIGYGVASGVKSVGFGRQATESAGAILEMDSSGRVVVRHGHHFLGQGAKTGLMQIATSELGIPLEMIEVVEPDTSLTPSTGATTASRQTFLTGNALVLASQQLKEELFGRAAEILDRDPARLKFDRDQIVDPKTGAHVALSELGDHFRFEKRFTTKPTSPFPDGTPSKYGQPSFVSQHSQWCYAYCTQVAIVGVNLKTGEVKVLTMISANDLGKVLNRQAVEGQIHGSISQGIGYALSEKFEVKDGINTTTTLNQLKMPLASQTPEIYPVLVEVPHPDGPQGAKGFAESPSLPTAPAILNAVYDAVGVRMRDLPADNKKILAALKERESQD